MNALQSRLRNSAVLISQGLENKVNFIIDSNMHDPTMPGEEYDHDIPALMTHPML
ncbi:hypothetical protein [Candidatus Thiodiazotropha sp. LNASS1]|uniref:hypothetical protein n=1 Tax=Candidatus Thiodiazotropha sp. LNASS1 TaxID=3096260 RepID=UPI0034723392